MKTFLKRLALCFGGALLLLLLFHLVENWRGRRAWRQWQQARINAGDSYDVTGLIPPAVADADNFACAPRIQAAVTGTQPAKGEELPVLPAVLNNRGAMGDWREGRRANLVELEAALQDQRIPQVLAAWQDELAALTAAAQRPQCRLLPSYAEDGPMPSLLGMRARFRVLALRALVAQREQRAEAALADLLTGLRVVSHLQREPHLLSQLLRTAAVNILMQPIWEGLQDHRWQESQLLRLEAALAPIDQVSTWALAWRFERRYMVTMLEAAATAPLFSRRAQVDSQGNPVWSLALFQELAGPRGWLYQNLLRIDQQHVAQFQEVFQGEPRRILVRNSERATAAAAQVRGGPYTAQFVKMAEPLATHSKRMAASQSSLDQARIAIALERHRLAKGSYPETLAALVPTYLAVAPVDVLEGQPLVYAPLGRDRYSLYSLGWNLSDEGGQVAPIGAEGNRPTDQGDWVWAAR